MDDRLQHQCAGFIQAEAEAFAEEYQEWENEEEDDDDDADTVRGNSDGNESEGTPTKNGKKNPRAKKSATKKKPSTATLVERVPKNQAAHLASEYAFISVVSYFLRAILPRAIDVSHAAVLLAYHGRLGVQFDQCLGTLVGVLREEGMFKGQGVVVEGVVEEAVRQVSAFSARLHRLIRVDVLIGFPLFVVIHDVHGWPNGFDRSKYWSR